MSGARITGNIPAPATILGVLDAHARDAISDARNVTKPILEAEAPGGLGRAMTATVRKTPTGHRMTMQAPRARRYPPGEATVAQVARWVNRGTGIHRKGPGPKRPITGRLGVLRPMTLPSGRRMRSVKGQKPNPFIARAETRAEPLARIAIEAGARRASAALRRL